MKYISIGGTCAVKYQIIQRRGSCESLFFDWLRISMESVLTVLSCGDISTLINRDTVDRHPLHPYHNEHSRIIFKSLEDCISIHDLLNEYSLKEKDDFILKYSRRFHRLIHYIQSKEQLIFIRTGFVEVHAIDRFIEILLKIHPTCDFLLVVIDHDIHHVEGIYKKKHCLYIKKNTPLPKEEDWTLSFLDWKSIFAEIEKYKRVDKNRFLIRFHAS